MSDLAAGWLTGEFTLDGLPAYEPPRVCPVCARRMKVQVRPDGWRAECSRHGELDSVLLDR